MNSVREMNRRLDEFAAFAERLADAASAITEPAFRSNLTVHNKMDHGAFDPVTEADSKAEEAMRELIEAEYPDHGIVGEELGKKDAQSEWSWILDPIDGTRAFIAGIPVWGTLIGLRRNGEPVLGMSEHPVLDQRFRGWNGQAQLNGRPIRVRPCESLGQAVLCTTAPEMFVREGDFDIYDTMARHVRLRRYGTDCLGYGLLASGHIDLVVEAGLSPYDIQPLMPVIRGAGGIVTDWTGNSEIESGNVIAAGDRRVHDAALALLTG